VSVWVPADGYDVGFYKCLRHPAANVFKPAKGSTCANCVTDPPPPQERDAKSSAPPAPPDAPSAADHEGAHLDRCDRLEKSSCVLLDFGDARLAECNRLLQEATNAKGKKQAKLQRQSDDALAQAISAFNTATKLEAEATKKRRAASEITRWREDWTNTEKLETELRAMRELHH
jgi:hypothetical protein